jgi:hypothetical protein
MVQILVKGESKTILKISGNVLYVIEGKVDSKTLQPLRTDDFRFALGSGTSKTPDKLGEAMVIEKRNYLSWIEKGKVVTKEEPTFESPFLMGIDEKQILGALIHCEPTPPSTLSYLYQEMAHRFPMGFAILGTALFAELHSTYLKKAPTSHENINKHHDEYWAPIKKEKGAIACIFGVVIPESARQKFPEKTLAKGFYHNPVEKESSTFDSHTHGALLSAGPEKWPHNMNEFFKSLKDLPVTSVRHLLTQSLLQEATFAIFPLGDIIVL